MKSITITLPDDVYDLLVRHGEFYNQTAAEIASNIIVTWEKQIIGSALPKREKPDKEDKEDKED